jgi:hypothetical protein
MGSFEDSGLKWNFCGLKNADDRNGREVRSVEKKMSVEANTTGK